MDLSDHVVVITGGAGGIGLATAQVARRNGGDVVICDIDETAVARAIDVLDEISTGSATGYRCDVSDRLDVRRVAESVCTDLGRIDILVNNAAVQKITPALELTEDHWLRELNVCLSGSFYWSQAAAEFSMVPRGKGSIVNVGSGAGLAASPDSVSYISAKHGIIGLTRSLAVDWARYGIRVNCVCPGFTWTPLAQQVSEARPEVMRQRVDRIPYGTGAQSTDIANAVLFLASNELSAATSGVVLPVDGGTTALSSGYTAPTADATPPSD